MPITTVADAARFVGIAPGAPQGVYRPSTPLEPDAPLPVDRDAAEVIAMWYELTDLALRSFATSIASDEPSEAQLWPEHFDLALSADRINYGGSPGDEQHRARSDHAREQGRQRTEHRHERCEL